MSEVKEITLTDLAEDAAFLNELREGQFVLVLGAGFSYGLPNKAGGTIPIVKEFVSLTAEKFKETIPPETDYNLAADTWLRYIEAEGIGGSEREKRFNEFKDLFLIDEELFADRKKLYSAILLPHWNHLYTFNFDNVLDVLVQDTRKDYEFQYLDVGSFSPTAGEGIGYLHNSILKAKSVSDLVFTNDQYANKIQNKSRDNHLYYALLNDIDNHKKNLVIIGCQFNEQTVYSYLLSAERGIRDDFKIYNINYNSKPNYGYEIEKLLPHNNWVDCSAADFLEFLQQNRHNIKKISLPGAETIDRGFIDSIRSGKAFSRSQFYCAKQDDHCQWFGILNDYDVIRNDYHRIKKVALNAFSKITTSKVVSVVHGAGGCGKSTLLRRLAMELCAETDFEIIWVKDRQLERFVTEALPEIRADFNCRYLVFIEDWYRLTGEDQQLGDRLLKTTQAISNVRLVIGDRDTTGKAYLLNLTHPQHVFELHASENKRILDEIISKHAEWKQSTKLVLNHHQTYKAPLFLILFAIAGVEENRIDNPDVDFHDLENTARRIARYDLRIIAEHYPGLAKALHYWSSVNCEYKIFITYETFLQIADVYNHNTEISRYFKNWRIDNEVLNKLKHYINVSPNETLAKRFQNLELIQFNHDILAESVLSKIALDGWQPFDDLQKKKLLDTITDYGDDYSASVCLRIFLEFEAQVFTDESEKITYIDKLFYRKKNRRYQYLSFLPKLHLSPRDLYTYIASLESEDLYPASLWLAYFCTSSRVEREAAARKILTHQDMLTLDSSIVFAAFKQPGNKSEIKAAAKQILTHKDMLTLERRFVIAAFKQSEDEIERKEAARKILTHKDIITLDGHIVIAAFKQSEDEIERMEAARRILTHQSILTLQQEIVVAAFKQSGNESEKKEAARRILTHKDIITLDGNIVIAAFKQSGNESEKKEAVRKILTHQSILTLDGHIVSAAFQQSGNEIEKKEAARKILTHKDIITLDSHIVVAAFKQMENKIEKIAAARKILTHPDILTLQQVFVVAAFKQMGNEAEKKAAAKQILRNTNWYNRGNLFAVLKSFESYSKFTPIPNFVNKKINSIIDSYLANRKRKINNYVYLGLIKIPFHQNGAWKRQCESIISNWPRSKRSEITSVLQSYVSSPESTSEVCSSIMRNWKTEISMSIAQFYGEPHYGDHIRLALGHPDLRDLARTTAGEIVKATEDGSVDVPDYLLEIVKLIVAEDIYPEWSTNDSDEIVVE